MELKNKTGLFLGSSVTFGSTAEGVSFVEFLGKQCGMICIKEAVSGTTLVDLNEKSYISRLKAIDTAINFDLFVCQLSTNDARLRLDINEIEKAIRFILDYVQKTFGCPIVFYTGTYFESDEYSKMIDLLYSLKEHYNFYILDLYHDQDMLNVSAKDYASYMRDPVHPTLLGYQKWWTPKFISFLEQLSVSG